MNRSKWMLPLVLALTLAFPLGGCEKMNLGGEAPEAEPQEGNVVLRASLYNIVPFDNTRAVQNIADYCTRLCFVLYQNDEQVTKVLQKAGDDHYGQVTVRLEPGTYQLLVLAHSSQGNPILTEPDFLQFTNKIGYTDTFYYYGDLVVGGNSQSHDISLQRATSLVRIIPTDEAPAEAVKVHLIYTGESGVFNAVTGWGGTVNSQQVTNTDIPRDGTPLTVNAYTFLREETGKLKINLTVHAAEGGLLSEKILNDVPLKNHMVTEYRGNIFTDSANEEGFSFTADTSWPVYEEHTF